MDDLFLFAEEIQNNLVNEGDVLVSYDVTALFTNIPVDEAIQIRANKAFKNKRFNNTYNLQLKRADPVIELLSVSVKNQLFQFDGNLFEQIDGDAMGSPLGPLLANVFMCSLQEQLQEEGTIPTFYKRYVDDTFAIMPIPLRKPILFLMSLLKTSCAKVRYGIGRLQHTTFSWYEYYKKRN